jgi:hypothetical protein
MDFIDQHRGHFGVESICKVLPIAPSTYFAHAARRRNPDLRSDRAKRDAALTPEVERVHRENFGVYGVRKVWRQMLREDFDVARFTVEWLMPRLGLQGVIRGKAVRTTIANPAAACPLDHVNRRFKATRPNELWVSDFTYGVDLARLRLRRLHHRHARAAHRRMEGLDEPADRLLATASSSRAEYLPISVPFGKYWAAGNSRQTSEVGDDKFPSSLTSSPKRGADFEQRAWVAAYRGARLCKRRAANAPS